MSTSENKPTDAPNLTAVSDNASTEERRPDEIRKDIEGTREELGDSVAALAEKTDVKKQAKAKLDDAKSQASAKADEAKLKAKELGERAKAAAPETPSEGAEQVRTFAKENPPVAIAAGALALFVLWRLLRR